MDNEPEALLAARLIERAAGAPGGVIHLARSPSRAARLAEAARALGEGVEVIHLPAWDCLPYDRVSPSAAVMGERMAALHRMATAPGQRLLVTSVEAAGQRLPEPARAAPLVLRRGETLDAEGMADALRRLGYGSDDDLVDSPGEFGPRGEVLDVFPAREEAAPYRLEVQDGRIAAIRRYDPVTQRSEAESEEVVLPPASEVVALAGEDLPERIPGLEHALAALTPRLVSVFDLWPETEIVAEPEFEEARDRRAAEVADAFRLRIAVGAEEGAPEIVEPARLTLDAAAWKAALKGRRLIHAEAPEEVERPAFLEEDEPEEAFLDLVEQRSAAGCRVALAGAGVRANTLFRLMRRRRGQAPVEVPGWLAFRALPPGIVAWLRAPLTEGFGTEGTVVVAAAEVLPARAPGRERLQRAAFGEATLRPGDAVVHIEHGLASLRGIEAVEAPPRRTAPRFPPPNTCGWSSRTARPASSPPRKSTGSGATARRRKPLPSTPRMAIPGPSAGRRSARRSRRPRARWPRRRRHAMRARRPS
ncbi:hypothetical protein ACE7GA_08845 [Roseomonas sp. CCTCC AB2023176]|uniref:hypothetical protein n=1 Tax=Roseomonas sp. CCTCC AB2023176 TaxID=3342640 RepID=UPI0035E14F5C